MARATSELESDSSIEDGPLPYGSEKSLEDGASPNGSEKSLEKTAEADHGDDKDTEGVMSGCPLIMLTIGMMTVVFLMTLDHYILGETLK